MDSMGDEVVAQELVRLIGLAEHEDTRLALSDCLAKVRSSSSRPTSSAAPSVLPDPPVSTKPSVQPVEVAPASTGSVSVPRSAGAAFITVDSFQWEQGEYGSPLVTVYVDVPGVGEAKDSVTCVFTKDSFDLQVLGLGGKNYRLLKTNLDKDIVPAESRYIVKKNKVILKLAKKKGEYSFDTWTALTSKKSKAEAEAAKKDPSAGIMDMMRDMYNDGDESMKKVIGEAMMKAQRGEKGAPPSMDF